ncbi:Phytosulfokine receptor 1 [Ananas comosus]|uniref:non-specific serine/threonine protein kinase n=1 Tax=Ananas comosus TaxID=4615 RepID=A0A199UCW4_ANACO|nr:Phytosulfokine receptor 1 [Ananas comosus]
MGNRGLPCFSSLLLLLLFAPLSWSQSQQSCDSSDLNALQGFVEGLESSALGWSFNGSSSSNCCNWRVIGLDLSKTSLKGSVSSSLGGLDQLKLLNLSYNSLRGPVPVELFHLPHLELLDLSTNRLSGLIPAESNLSSIQVFNISFNSFNGTHPIFAGSSNLSVYDVSLNRFSGPVDTGICNSSDSIKVLRFSANMFSGEFLRLRELHFKNFTSLSDLSLSGNNFANLFSALQILQNLPNLTNLVLTKNFRGGFANTEVFVIANCALSVLSAVLHVLDLSWNNISGTIPDLSGMKREDNAKVVADLDYSLELAGSRLVLLFQNKESKELSINDILKSTENFDQSRIIDAAALGCKVAIKRLSGDYCQMEREFHAEHTCTNLATLISYIGILNENFEAHLADFGLARLILPYDTHVTTDLVGTLGYIPPEYGQSAVATYKGDVYSFGVVLLELLTGRRPVDMCKPKGSRDVVSWVIQMKKEKKGMEVIDPHIYDKENNNEVMRMLEIACLCVSDSPKLRPLKSVVDEVKDLKICVQIAGA